MAKLTAPLMSLDARGQIGKTLVFIGWKGIKSVRQFVVPANPNSVAQQAQRLVISNCVKGWKLLDAVAKSAWNSWAPYEAKPMSGFNSMTKAGVTNIAADPLSPIVDTLSLTPGSTILTGEHTVLDLDDQSSVGSATDFSIIYGTDPRDLTTVSATDWNAGTSKYDITLTGLSNDVQYWGRIRMDSPILMLSGLFSFTPTA